MIRRVMNIIIQNLKFSEYNSKIYYARTLASVRNFNITKKKFLQTLSIISPSTVDRTLSVTTAGSLRLSSRRNSARRATTPARARTPSPHANNSEVSILVTEASPDAAPPPSAPPTVVRVLVHRESDEQPS